MERILSKELEKLKNRLLAMSALVEENVHKSLHAFVKNDLRLARNILESDRKIDKMEVEIEDECLGILALHQPVAIDLRLIIVVLKINNDLERIGDQAVNIAHQVSHDSVLDKHDIGPLLEEMGVKAQDMLKKSLDSFVFNDVSLAFQICRADDEVDELNREILSLIMSEARHDPDHIESLIRTLLAARNLERIGDLATNICEDVIYLNEGEIVRHKLQVKTGRDKT